MNAAQKQDYREKDSRKRQQFERKYVRRVYNALQEQMKEAADVLQNLGRGALDIKLNRSVFVQDLAPVIRDMWVEMGVYYAGRTLRTINRSAREEKAGFGVNEKWNEDILEYFRTRLLSRSVAPISQTTIERIREIISIGQREGWSTDRMAFEIENDTLTIARARLIVRTENTLAQHYGKQLGRRESKWETVEVWISAHDARTRHGHREVDGNTVEEGGRFRVNRYNSKGILIGFDMMSGPGDPHAHADNLCNCRCTSAVVAARDAEGNLKPRRKKSNISVILPGQRSRLPTITV